VHHKRYNLLVGQRVRFSMENVFFPMKQKWFSVGFNFKLWENLGSQTEPDELVVIKAMFPIIITKETNNLSIK
jgi:hypothetical protein